MIATPTDIRNVLALSDDEIAELQKQQEKALKKFRSRAKLSEEEKREGRAWELVAHHQKTGNKDALAEAYAMLGQFETAADVAANPKLKEVLAEKAAAVASSDDDCECPTFNDDKLPTQYIEANVFSTKHGAVMPAIRCRVCGGLNVRPILPHLADQRAARQTSLANESRQVKATEFFK